MFIRRKRAISFFQSMSFFSSRDSMKKEKIKIQNRVEVKNCVNLGGTEGGTGSCSFFFDWFLFSSTVSTTALLLLVWRNSWTIRHNCDVFSWPVISVAVGEHQIEIGQNLLRSCTARCPSWT